MSLILLFTQSAADQRAAAASAARVRAKIADLID